MSDVITETWMRKQDACSSSFPWMKKQKKKDWKSVSRKLVSEKRLEWCFWLLYRKDTVTKFTFWSLVILSYVLSGISLYLSIFSGFGVWWRTVSIIALSKLFSP